MSPGGIFNFSSTLGSAIVILAWSSIIANPSIEILLSGCVRVTGQVLLKDAVLILKTADEGHDSSGIVASGCSNCCALS